ncbi:glycosyltransferase family 39 protein [Bradyrhizobium sp. SYSU BS000235]|uniref:glycosyltransferase family 39 protein n=1 Tax=Bradyrhizobium sp. SYSU BS000235 TaxID=3411332 RepID=UPI003C77222A
MRFTSLIVELVRARPRLIFWIAVLAQAALWFIVPTILYGSPPGDTATVLAFGREYQVGTQLGPPAAFWLADIAFRLSGNHIFGVYLLSQVCFVVTFWALFQLGRAIVGGQQAVLAVLLTATITAFSFPGIEFGPLTLARPLWALVLLHSWQVIGQGKRSAWFALSIEAGLLLLTTMAAIPLLVMLAIFALATKKGRHALASTDPVFALMVVMVTVLPYAVWLERGAALIIPPLPQLSDLEERLIHWGQMLAGLVFALFGVALLLIFNSRKLNGKPEDAPVIYRPGVAPSGRLFVYVFTIAPVLVLSFAAASLGTDKVIGGDGLALLLVGLAVIVTASDLIYLRRQHVLRSVWLAIMAAPVVVVLAVAFIQPWTGTGEIKTALPATDIGKFFGENFERRTGRPLAAVAGDPQLAMLIGFAAPGRPHVLLDATPQQTPWITFASFNQTGGVVVWRAADTVGTPPGDLVKRFPGLVPEVPRTFERLVTGRQPQLRIGWAIVRPQAAQVTR